MEIVDQSVIYKGLIDHCSHTLSSTVSTVTNALVRRWIFSNDAEPIFYSIINSFSRTEKSKGDVGLIKKKGGHRPPPLLSIRVYQSILSWISPWS